MSKRLPSSPIGRIPLSMRGTASGKAIRAIGKIKDKTWENIAKAFTAMGDVVKAGGFTALMGGPIDVVKEQIKTSITGAFAPILNEVTQFISDFTVQIGNAITAVKEFEIVLPGGRTINPFDEALNVLKSFATGFIPGLLTLFKRIATELAGAQALLGGSLLPPGTELYYTPEIRDFLAGGIDQSERREREFIGFEDESF